MIFRGREQLNIQPEKERGASGFELHKTYFEKEKRPDYRYYYHATFLPLLEKIEKNGSFKFAEHVPGLTLSPDYSFKFIENEIKRGPEWVKNRGKHLSLEEKGQFRPENLNSDDGVMLIIEPTDEYKIHSTAEGRPNIFSTPDQIPEDVNDVIRTRIWSNYQHSMFKESIHNTHSSGIKHPGMNLNKKMLPDGTWENLPREQRINIPGELPASSIKMAIKRNPVFLNIFDELRQKLKEGGKTDLSLFSKRLLEYFKNGDGLIKDEISDKVELAENMVTGELEHFLVNTIRNLYLDIQRYKGKKIIHGKSGQEQAKLIKSKEQILEAINKLNSIEPENEVFKRYIQTSTKQMGEEL
jgi:hypothetical protein